jgi:hypothetical protein
LSEAVSLNAKGQFAPTPWAEQALADFRKLVVPDAKARSGMAFFPTPADASWSNVRIRFLDGHSVSISVRGITGTLHFSQMGMADRRNAKPTQQWELLRAFSKYYGQMTWDHRDATPKNQKRREYLARNLKTFFRIDGEPIVLTEDKKGWRTVFAIEPDA